MAEGCSAPLGVQRDRAACDDPVDMAHLGRFTLGDRELEREVLDLFRSQALVNLERLTPAGTPQDWREACHAIKGSAAAVGAWRVAEKAAIAESLAQVTDMARRRQGTAQLRTALNEASDYIGCLFKSA